MGNIGQANMLETIGNMSLLWCPFTFQVGVHILIIIDQQDKTFHCYFGLNHFGVMLHSGFVHLIPLLYLLEEVDGVLFDCLGVDVFKDLDDRAVLDDGVVSSHV